MQYFFRDRLVEDVVLVEVSAAEVEQGSASRSTRVPTSSPGPQKATRAAVYWKRY